MGGKGYYCFSVLVVNCLFDVDAVSPDTLFFLPSFLSTIIIETRMELNYFCARKKKSIIIKQTLQSNDFLISF